MKYVIVGGGTAGWLTALYVKKNIPYSQVTVIASSDIGVLGAGEGTTFHFIDFLKKIDITPQEIIDNAKGTVKRGIRFTNWNGDGNSYFHPFFNGNKSALHFDANLLSKYLETVAISRDILLIDDIVENIITDDKKYITDLQLKSGKSVKTNFVFDCSGFRRLIIGGLYKTNWVSYSDKLPAKKAIPFFVTNDNTYLPEYTESIAMKYGWIWKIPVQGRYGCGYVFDSDFVSEEDILKELEKYLGYKIKSPKTFTFNAGCFEKTWINNCIAIGLSAGFTEPLEATSIWVSIVSLQMIESKIDGIISRDQKSIEQFNLLIRNMNEEIVNFLYLHYLSKKKDSKFWETFKEKNKTPKYIKNIKTFKTLSQYDLNYLNSIYYFDDSKERIETFGIESWNTIMDGVRFYES